MRGGARAGSGRPVTNPTKSVSTRLNERQRAELKLRGGAPAIKAWLDQLPKKVNMISENFSTEEIAAFRTYEAVRSAGDFNMFEQAARVATGLSDSQYLFVMKNFSALREIAAMQTAA